MDRDHFGLSERYFVRLEPHLPTDTRGKPRVNDRRVLSGIIQALRSRWPLGRRPLDPWPAQDALQSDTSNNPIRDGMSAGQRRAARSSRMSDPPMCSEGRQLTSRRATCRRPPPGDDAGRADRRMDIGTISGTRKGRPRTPPVVKKGSAHFLHYLHPLVSNPGADQRRSETRNYQETQSSASPPMPS